MKKSIYTELGGSEQQRKDAIALVKKQAEEVLETYAGNLRKYTFLMQSQPEIQTRGTIKQLNKIVSKLAKCDSQIGELTKFSESILDYKLNTDKIGARAFEKVYPELTEVMKKRSEQEGGECNDPNCPCHLLSKQDFNSPEDAASFQEMLETTFKALGKDVKVSAFAVPKGSKLDPKGFSSKEELDKAIRAVGGMPVEEMLQQEKKGEDVITNAVIKKAEKDSKDPNEINPKDVN